MVTNTANCCFWSAYGVALLDPIIYVPNVLGALLGFAQVALVVLFPRNTQDEIENGTTEPSTQYEVPEKEGKIADVHDYLTSLDDSDVKPDDSNETPGCDEALEIILAQDESQICYDCWVYIATRLKVRPDVIIDTIVRAKIWLTEKDLDRYHNVD